MYRNVVTLLLLAPTLASCGDGTPTDAPAPIASVEVAPAEAAVVPGGTIRLRADVRDLNGSRPRNPVVG